MSAVLQPGMSRVAHPDSEARFDPGNPPRESIYPHEQAGLDFPATPVFASLAAQRQHLQERLVSACRAFALQGSDCGFAGQLTVRDPEHLVPPERARYSREHVGSEYIGWLHFQPVWTQLVATQPDMFD